MVGGPEMHPASRNAVFRHVPRRFGFRVYRAYFFLGGLGFRADSFKGLGFRACSLKGLGFRVEGLGSAVNIPNRRMVAVPGGQWPDSRNRKNYQCYSAGSLALNPKPYRPYRP